jgi:FtsP/CotA-like multicopper oxidase with cupredoxin domain
LHKLYPLLSWSVLTTIALIFPSPASGAARSAPAKTCPSAVAPINNQGSSGASTSPSIESPQELRSRSGRLEVHLRLRNAIDPAGQMQYCYIDELGDRSPTLRLRPGDLLVLRLTNELQHEAGNKQSHLAAMEHRAAPEADCKSTPMAIDGTNLHFHGLSISPSCHSDDSLHVSIPPSKTFVYRVRIPTNQPPGLYWYHPHPHGHSEEQVLGGASGALIVEGMAAANPLVRGLPERVFVIRDQKLRHQTLNEKKSADKKSLDSEANASATSAPQRDPSLPARDLSLNFTPVPYPDYPVATINARPLTREFWRVLNASADTYVNLGVLFNGEWRDGGIAAEHGSWQSLELVALDGVPLSDARFANPTSSPRSSMGTQKTISKTEILIPPGGRAEFIFETPPEGVKAELITVGANTNPLEDEDAEPSAPETPNTIPDNDDNTPPRPLVRIVTSRSAVEPRALTEAASSVGRLQFADLVTVSPARQRTLYFSQKVMDPQHPETSTIFYLTEEGHTPKAFDPSAMTPDIVVHQGDVEDWTIENRSRESHAFHIHQSHFLLLERDREPAAEPALLDTVDVPYWDGSSTEFPAVKVRMDFRDPDIVGTFPYHCHILQHVDAGMMGLIEVRKKEEGRP